MTSTTSVMEARGDGRGKRVELTKLNTTLMAQAATCVNCRATEAQGEKGPEAALLNTPMFPPTGGGILQHPMSVALPIMFGTAEAGKILVQSMWRKIRSLDSSSKTTLACDERQYL